MVSLRELAKPIASIESVRSCLEDNESRARFNYFKKIASAISLSTDDGKNILGSYYEKIDFVREDTILANYLSGDISNNFQPSANKNIFPFGFNESQKIATENAINNRLSIIQGPPGTGKTQTILNIMANIVRDGKTVAVVSNNNSATDNIYEKLQGKEVDFIVARLGSSDNKQKFISDQYVPSKEKLLTWEIKNYNEYSINKEIDYLTQEIESILQKNTRLAILHSQLDSILIESRHFYAYYNDNYQQAIMPNFTRTPSADALLDLWNRIEGKNGKLSIFDKIWTFFICHVRLDGFFRQSVFTTIATIQRLFYDTKIVELNEEIKIVEKYITIHGLDEKIKRHVDLSMNVFRSYVAKRYLKKPRRLNYSIRDLWNNSKNFIQDYPVVLSTTYSLRNSLSNGYIYDYVIIDEASQVDLATLVLALSCAKRAVIVGDIKQLPNVITTETKRKDREILSEYSMPEQYILSNHSALSSMIELFGNKIPTQLLREHYRCHPKIIGFCNKMFYDDQLIILTKETETADIPLRVYETAQGNHARNDHINNRQLEVTINEVVPIEGLNLSDGSVGIVTPYKNQAKAISDLLNNKATLAATVDKFQGRERDTIIINTVDNKIGDFASNPNRLNVAVSRAKKRLIIVTNGNNNSSHTGIDELVDYIRYNNYEITNSSTRSIFDYLYSSYYEQKAKKIRRGSSPAEDLMFDLLDKIYKDNNFTNLSTKIEYPIKMLIDISNLKDREREYAENDWTRVDFVVFSKVSKQPLLAVEVDGYAYHRAGNSSATKQHERDLIKNKLLHDAGIPLVRFSTVGSNEEAILTEKLKELFNN